MMRTNPHITLRCALLSSVLLTVSCTTSSISTPGIGPTAALDNVAAGSTAEQEVATLPESTTIVPRTAAIDEIAKPVEALALNATPANDVPNIVTTEVASNPVVEQKTASVETGAIAASETLAQPATTALAANAVAEAPKVTPKAAIPKAPKAEPTGIFALFKKKPSSAEKTIAQVEPVSAQSAEKPKTAAEKTTRITTAAPTPRKAVKNSTLARALPGVRTKNIFGISGATETAKKVAREVTQPVQLASANIGSAARAVGNGIKKQTPSVSVKCFKPELVKMIKKIERHYGKPVIVTSGYRSPKRNRRAGGSKKSLHMYCAAADVQVKGVSKWALAKYIRSMPGRGGVGTYCHTKSVHLDIGSKRDWNWRCRRK